ncbi:unnamed protein product [Aphanomyces euteiches]
MDSNSLNNAALSNTFSDSNDRSTLPTAHANALTASATPAAPVGGAIHPYIQPYHSTFAPAQALSGSPTVILSPGRRGRGRGCGQGRAAQSLPPIWQSPQLAATMNAQARAAADDTGRKK